MKLNPLLNKDFYKTDHIRQYPEGTQMVYSNLTPRASKIATIDHVVTFGIQAFIRDLKEMFEDEFFSKDCDKVISLYKRRMDNALGPDSVSTDHLKNLHKLGFLPIEIKALPEGSVSALRVPVLTIKNTNPDFFWLTNFLETWISDALWHPITSATLAYQYRKILDKFANETSDMPDFVSWQGHDFSMRGHTNINSAITSGAAHLLSFTGTDTIQAIDYLEHYYGADATKELIGGSVPATEHSVMCLGSKESELETFERLITKVYPQGIVSIVSDTWDYWKVLDEILPALKDKIMNRNGKVVIRPDSGDPVQIVCGHPGAFQNSSPYKGTIETLWDIFGGTINSKGYKQLDPHIGCIYGDSITLDRCEKICSRLQEKGFASTNIVFGIGSFTYQYVTRDTFGFAVKATYGIVNGHPVEIYKDPITDNGIKKSAKGLLKVNEDFSLNEGVTEVEEKQGLLKTVFLNGNITSFDTLSEIRKRLLKK